MYSLGSLLPLNTTNDSLHLFKLQIILSAPFPSKICKYLKLLRKVWNYSVIVAAHKLYFRYLGGMHSILHVMILDAPKDIFLGSIRS